VGIQGIQTVRMGATVSCLTACLEGERENSQTVRGGLNGNKNVRMWKGLTASQE